MSPAPLLDLRVQGSPEGTEPVQVLEGLEYRYEVVDAPRPITLEPRELFQPDTSDGQTGRLRPGLATGRVSVTAQVEGVRAELAALEVRSRKLKYLSEYRWMLRDIAEAMAETIMQHLAPSEQWFSLDLGRPAQALYQQFAFLRAILQGSDLEAALHRIQSYPYLTWDPVVEERSSARGLRMSSELSRQVARAGRRQDWPQGPVSSLPAAVQDSRTEPNVDNVPNRFVRFCLEQWRDTVTIVRDHVVQQRDVAGQNRFVDEADGLLSRLEEHLSAALLQEVGPLDAYPHGNQVIMNRDGYRDLFRLYLASHAAASLSWQGGDEIYGAGQKNVAVLYEYWVYVQLAQLLGQLTGQGLHLASLVRRTDNGLAVGLERGRHQVLSGIAARGDRRMQLEFWYNRTFAENQDTTGSWSREMRPDFSLLIRPEGEASGTFEPIWLHFDAKYRLDRIEDAFGARQRSAEDAVSDNDGQKAEVKREDLLKMHAYRDAIRRSAGAFVVYPGSEHDHCREYQEILPGLGAFPLKPTESGGASGVSGIRSFIGDVLDHVASQMTQHERGRYWLKQVYGSPPPRQEAPSSAPFLRRPPADTTVLCGYVRGEDHWRWIHDQRLYNLRADARRGAVPLAFLDGGVDYVLLYGRPPGAGCELWRVDGPPVLLGKEELLASGYPAPTGRFYLCLPLAEHHETTVLSAVSPARLTSFHVARVPGAIHGQPFRVTWSELVEGITATN